MPRRHTDFFTLVIDQGTSSTKIFLFNKSHEIVFSRRLKHVLSQPKPFHVEVDALNIAESCLRLIKQALRYSQERDLPVLSIGLALQRSTFLFWDKKTGKPVSPALSWQDGRAHKIISELSELKGLVFSKTGAPLNSHFGGPKFLHLIRHDPALKRGVLQGKLWFGPLSAYLIHYLTGTAAVDHTIASRSLVMDLNSGVYDNDLLNIFSMPASCLPNLVPSIHNYGHLVLSGSKIPVKCVIGDQQAALLGHNGWKKGRVAINLGTSASVQINAGKSPAHIPGLISSVLYSDYGQKSYFIEGTVNSCNSIFYWLEKELKIPHEAMLWHERCLNTTTDLVLIPGFAGLAAPYWVDKIPFTLNDNIKHRPLDETIRAGMESIGFLVYDIWEQVLQHLNLKPHIVRVSGGGARKPLLQFITDLCRFKIGRVQTKDSTALGVHYLLLKADGIKPVPIHHDFEEIFSPLMKPSLKNEKLLNWHGALKAAGIRKEVSFQKSDFRGECDV
ncbi:MAG: FGGY family carbohydrate kinase [Candidatus Neomarinimicrobiota bacterium]